MRDHSRHSKIMMARSPVEMKRHSRRAAHALLRKAHTRLLSFPAGSVRAFSIVIADGPWNAVDTGFIRGTSGSGIFSIALFDLKNGVIVGGNYEKPGETKDNLGFTTDGGETWKLGTGLTGYRSGVTYVDKKTIIAVGTNGSDITRDGGKTWKVLGKEDLNAVQAKGKRAVWAVGPKGMVVKLK